MSEEQAGQDEVIPEDKGTPEGGQEAGKVEGGEAEGSAPKGEAAPAPDDSWKDKRIAKLTAQRRELEAKLAAKPADGATADEVRAQAIAKERLELESFNSRCNEARAAGDAAYPDFGARINSLVSIRDPEDKAEVDAYNMLVRVALDTGEGPKVLHALGGDLSYARKVLEMTPHKMGIELAKLAAANAAKPSGAPKPITPVGGKGTTHAAIDPTDKDRADGLSMAAWMERRSEQVRARFAARRGR